jgi:hypothetical protein
MPTYVLDTVILHRSEVKGLTLKFTRACNIHNSALNTHFIPAFTSEKVNWYKAIEAGMNERRSYYRK